MRLLLLNWNAAEYTDGIYYMTQDILQGKYPPLYPALIHLLNFIFNDLEFTGKLISMLAGALSIFPIYQIGKQVYNPKTGLYAVLLYSVSPMMLRWSIRVMSDATFGLFFILSIWFAVRLWRSQKKQDLIWCTFTAGLCALTRANGVLLLPLLVFLYVLYLRKNSLKQLVLSPVWAGALPWFLLLAWLLLGGTSFSNYSSYAFIGRGEGLIPSVFFFAENFTFHFESLVWEVTALIVLFACFGIYQSLHLPENNTGTRYFWLGLCVYTFVAWFGGMSVYSAWQHLAARHFYAIVPLILLLSGYGIYSIGYHLGRRRLFLASLVGCILFSLVFSAASLYYQRDSLGDVKRAAVYARQELQGETIFTDEIEKTSFWAHRSCRSYLNKDEIQPGQYVILHSLYTDIETETSYLASRFKTEIVYETASRIRPLLSDLLEDFPTRGALPSSPEWMIQRFKTQRFTSVVIKLTAKE